MLFYLDNWQSVGPNSEIALYGPGRFAVRDAGRVSASATAGEEPPAA